MNVNTPATIFDSNFCGVVFGGGENAISHVPLLRSVINVLVIDVFCRVTVIQTYRNEANEATPTARYVFPVPSRAAICAFSMMIADETVIYAEAKDTIEAMKEFDQAVAEGKAAALQEQVSGDIFRISLGSIPAREKIKTKTVFVMDLMNSDFLSNKVQLLLPLALGQRYGTPPPQLADAAGHVNPVRLKISVDIQMSGIIESITSPSHEQDINLDEYVTHAGRFSQRRGSAKLTSTTFLDRDFELVIQAKGLDRSRCFAEKDPRFPGTIALQLMLIPKFELSPIPEQEYLFLIDRSGSMSGKRLDMAKECVTLLLKLLPEKRTLFNIFDFESNYRRLWPQSRPYDDQTLQEATTHVNGLFPGAGTELSVALKALLDSRRPSMPTAVFILTDGEIAEQEAGLSLSSIQDTISAFPNAPLRLFILGIGNTVSSDVCSRLAAAGNGSYLLAVSPASILLKCTSLLRAGSTSSITDVSVDWMVAPGPAPHFQVPQCPIPEMSLAFRSAFFAIIQIETIPEQVVIRGKADGRDVSFPVDVETAKFGRQLSEPPFFHTLVAHQLIRGLEDNVNGINSETRELIVRLGELYQMASSCTSFVAVDGAHHDRPRTHISTASTPPVTVATSFIEAIWQVIGWFGSSTAAGHPKRRQNERLPGGWSTPDDADSGVSSESDTEYTDSEGDSDWDSDRTFSTLSSLESHSSGDSGQPRRRRHPHQPPAPPAPMAPYTPPPTVAPSNDRTERFKPPPIDSHVLTLFQHMSASGSFSLTDDLGAIVGMEALKKAKLWENEELAATALAIVYLEKRLGDHRELFELLIEKGKEFAKSHPNGGIFEEMLHRAQAVI